MKRNLDLMRDMLLLIEKNTSCNSLTDKDFSSLNPDMDVIDYHICLLADSGYINYDEFGTLGRFYPEIAINWLTSSGCDYLDSVRSTRVWEKTKEKLSEIGGRASLGVIKTVAEHVALSVLGL